MDNNHNSAAREHPDVVSKNMVVAADRLCAAFSHTSALGFAIYDDRLRYQLINDALGIDHRIPAAAHMGNTTRDLLGNCIADKVEPYLRRVMTTSDRLGFEFTACLSTREEPVSWLGQYFPIHGAVAKTIGTGLVVVDVTEQRKLERFVNQLAHSLRRKESRDNWWLPRELHNSVAQYHFALGLKIDQLIGRADKNPAVLAEAVACLDERVRAMRQLLTLCGERISESRFEMSLGG
jgi:hypothetical protein